MSQAAVSKVEIDFIRMLEAPNPEGKKCQAAAKAFWNHLQIERQLNKETIAELGELLKEEIQK